MGVEQVGYRGYHMIYIHLNSIEHTGAYESHLQTWFWLRKKAICICIRDAICTRLKPVENIHQGYVVYTDPPIAKIMFRIYGSDLRTYTFLWFTHTAWTIKRSGSCILLYYYSILIYIYLNISNKFLIIFNYAKICQKLVEAHSFAYMKVCWFSVSLWSLSLVMRYVDDQLWSKVTIGFVYGSVEGIEEGRPACRRLTTIIENSSL